MHEFVLVPVMVPALCCAGCRPRTCRHHTSHCSSPPANILHVLAFSISSTLKAPTVGPQGRGKNSGRHTNAAPYQCATVAPQLSTVCINSSIIDYTAPSVYRTLPAMVSRVGNRRTWQVASEAAALIVECQAAFDPFSFKALASLPMVPNPPRVRNVFRIRTASAPETFGSASELRCLVRCSNETV